MKSTNTETTGGAADVNAVIRLAADEFEERTVGMIEGFVVSIKDHLDVVILALRNH